MSTSSSLHLKDICFYYAGTCALKNITTHFTRGEITALIGPSGSGKSTLLRVLNRIYELYPGQHVSGRLYLEDQDLMSPGIDVNQMRKEIGMVFQKPTPFPMSIFDNIAFAVKAHEKPGKAALKARVEQALKQAALWEEVKDKLGSPGESLSGGQQQRLCIARTLAVQPRILLLDEPTSSLDPVSTSKIEALIRNLKQTYTIIIVTHNLKQAHRISDRTIFLRDGEVVEQNDTATFFTAPRDPRSIEYVHHHD